MMEYFERKQLPGDVQMTLASALNGDLHFQHLLFVAMMDTWPKLQKNINEICRLVSVAPWKVIPAAERGEKPSARAEKLAKEIETMIWTMEPRVTRNECGFEGTVKALAAGYYFGHAVSEIRWKKARDGSWRPRATKAVPARYYGYPYDTVTPDDPEDRLMYDFEGSTGGRQFIDFPDKKFLAGINAGHPGHPSVAAPLRALSSYWLAAIYGLPWLMDFTQIYGIPWRHAEVPEGKDKSLVARALESMGPKGYVVTDQGVKINTVASSQSAQSLPQRELIDLADKQCDIFILGQTLTSGTDRSGSRALGEVHADTKNAMVDAVADFVGEILTHQLCPYIVAANGADKSQTPQIWAKREEVKDEKAKAERMEILLRSGYEIGEAFAYEDVGVPVPAPGEKLFLARKAEPITESKGAMPPRKPPGKPAGGGIEGDDEEVKAADAAPSDADEESKQRVFDAMEDALEKGKLLDWKTVAIMMAAGFVDGLADDGKGGN